MSNSIRLKDNSIFAQDYAGLVMAGRKTLSITPWIETDFPFTVGTDYFYTNNNNLFEFVTGGIKCKFKGLLMVIKEMSLDTSVRESEFDLVDDYGTFYQVRGTNKYVISVHPCNINDIKKLTYITGVSSVECYNARLFITRIG